MIRTAVGSLRCHFVDAVSIIICLVFTLVHWLCVGVAYLFLQHEREYLQISQKEAIAIVDHDQAFGISLSSTNSLLGCNTCMNDINLL